MARKVHRPDPARTAVPPTGLAASRWPDFVLTALIAATLGAGGTYLALRPALTRQATAILEAAHTEAIQGDSYEDHQDWPQAIAAYLQAIAGGLDNPNIRTDLGVAYFRSGQLQQALGQYAIAQTQNPNHENSLFNQGAVFVELGDAAKATAVWQQYIQRFPQGQHTTQARQLIAQVQAHGLPSDIPKR